MSKLNKVANDNTYVPHSNTMQGYGTNDSRINLLNNKEGGGQPMMPGETAGGF